MAEDDISPVAPRSMDGVLISTFVNETLQGNYNVHLNGQDIVNIARIEYGWRSEDTNIFQVIADIESEKGQVEHCLDRLRKQEINLATLVISLNHSHWVTLVITNRRNNSFNQNLLAYYADSIANTIPQLIKDILTGIEIEILSAHQEDPNGWNSGLFALENARAINEALKEGRPVDLSKIPNERDHLKLRRSQIALKIACHNLQLNAVPEIRNQSSPKADNSKKSSTKNAKSHLTETTKESKKLYYPKRSGTSGISGQLYETRLTMLVLKRCLKSDKIVKFHLGTNVDRIGVFDDLILSCHYNDNRHRVIFLQAKHRDDPEKNKITLANFTKENGDISFDKCFDSYLKVRRKFDSSSNDEVFKSEFRNINCDLVVFTSGIASFGSENLTKKIDPSEDDLLQTNSQGKIFQFNCDERNIIDQVMRSASISRMKQLAESLTKFICSRKSNYSNMMSDELIRTYHAILARKVIKVAEQGKDDCRDGTMRPEFYENNESLVTVLREALYKESVTYVNSKLQPGEAKALIEETVKNLNGENVSRLLGNVLIYDAESNRLKLHSKAKLTEIDVKNVKKILQRITTDVVVKAIAIAGRKKLEESISFPLHNVFGNVDFKVKGEQRLKHVTQKLVELVTKSTTKDNKIVVRIDGDMVGPMRPIKDGDIAINGGIGGLVGNLLVLDDETKMLKFTNDRETLPENAKKLLSMLQKDLSEDQLNNARFHITLNDFPLLSFECEESLVKDFLKVLKIYTNQAKEDQVENILKTEISSDYDPSEKMGTLPYRIKSDAICLKVHDEIQKWWKRPDQGFYLSETCKFFNDAQRSIIDSPLLGVLDFLYLNRIKQYNIEFDSSSIDDLELANFLVTPDVQVLTITTAEIELSAIKLLQYSEKAEISTTFLNLDYVFARHCYREVIGELKMEETLLIIVWENKKYLNEFPEKIENILNVFKRRKTILLIGNSVYEEVKGNLLKESTVRIDRKLCLAHLALKSQNELLKEKEIIFQGNKVKLSQLIDNDSNDLVLGNTLSKLLRNEPVEVGKMPTIDTKPYYVERRFFREIKFFFCSLKPVDIFAVSQSVHDGDLESANLNGRILRSLRDINRHESQPENFIILLEDRQFEDLCKIYPNHNIHLLEYYRRRFILKQTYGDISNIKDALERGLILGNLENEFCDKFISNEIDKKVVVISAEPGMGKSTILTNMTKYIKDNYTSMWLVRVNLNDYTQILERYNFANGLNSAIGFLSTIIGLETDLEKGLFERSIKKRGKISLFFDGFDEISPNYEAVVMKLLKALEKSKVEKILVTTRPYNFESDLEQELNALKIGLVGLDVESQNDFLIKFWEVSLGIEISNDPPNRAHQFANWLTGHFKSSLDYFFDDNPFLSIPIHCMLTAEYFKENFKEFYDSGTSEFINEQKDRLNMQLNLSSLYREFVKGKYFEVYCKNKKKKDLTNVDVAREEENCLYPKFLQEHRLLALLALLSENDFNKILSETEKEIAFRLRDEFQRGEGKAGMIYKIVAGKPQFIHRTFAEYFAGCYFWGKYKSIEFNRFEEFIRFDIRHCLNFQTCLFFEFEAQRDLKDQLEFLHRKEKLEFLLSEHCLSLFKTSRQTYLNLELLSKLIDFQYDENMIIQKHKNLEMKEKLGLLRVYCGFELKSFIKVLAMGINQQDLMDDLEKGCHEKYDTKLVHLIENATHDYFLADFLKNVDIDFLNHYKFGNVSSVVLFLSRFYKYPILLQNLINRRLNVNGDGEEKLKPIHVIAYQFSPRLLTRYGSLPISQRYTEISNSIEILLQNGAIYNLKDEFGRTALHYVTRAYKILLFFTNIMELKLLNSSFLDKIAKKALQLVIQDLDVNYSTLSYKVLFPPLYKQVLFHLKSFLLRSDRYLTEGDIADKPYNKIERDFNNLVDKLETERNDIVKAHLIYPYHLIYENHYDRLVSLLFNKVNDFHAFQNSNDAFTKIKEHFESAVKQMKSFFTKIPGIEKLESPYKFFEIDEILKILSLEDITLDRRIADSISEIHELNGTEYLCQMLFAYISSRVVDDRNKTVSTDFDQVSESFQLLTTIDESFKAAQNSDNQALKNLLQKTEPNILETVTNTRNENRQTLLDIAEDLKNTDMVEMVKEIIFTTEIGRKIGLSFLNPLRNTVPASSVATSTSAKGGVGVPENVAHGAGALRTQ